MANPRQKVRGLQIKAEVTEGLDPAGWTSADVLPLTDLSAELNFETQALNEFGGSLDSGETILGGSKPAVTATYAFRGSGVAGTPLAPVSSSMLAAGFEQTLRAATLPAAAVQTVATGTANTVTFPNTGTGTQWPTTTALGLAGANAVIGEPVELAGDPAIGTWATIIDYAVVATNITLTLSRNATDCGCVGAVFTSATTVKRPIGVKWRIYTPNPHPSVYLREFFDVGRQDYSASRPNIRAEFNAGGFSSWTFTYAGKLITPMVNDTTPAAAAVPSPATGVNCWVTYNGGSLVSAQLAASQFTFDLGNTTEYPGNLNALQGFDPATIGSRKIVGSVNPILVAPGTRNLLGIVTNQTKGTLGLGWGPRTSYGSFVGNKVSVIIPQWKYTGYSRTTDAGTIREVMNGEATTFDSGLYIYEW